MVHFKINDDPIFERYIFAVLSADFEYCIDLRVYNCCAGGLGGYFVNDDIRSDEITGEISARACSCRAEDIDFAGDFFADDIKALPDRFKGFSGCHKIGLTEYAALCIHYDNVCANRADVDSKIRIERPFSFSK